MVFKRRDTRSWLQATSHFFYPKGGWSRAVYYVLHRLRRLPDPPHRIARGVAAGVFVCFTPFFGFHFFLAAILAFIMQGNILAALLATFFGNPITFPIIVAVSLELGHWMVGQPGAVHLPQVFGEFSQAAVEIWANITALFTADVVHWDRLHRFFNHVFFPYLIGGIGPGIISATVMYSLTVPAVTAYQKRRLKKLKARFEKRQQALESAKKPVEQDRGDSLT